MFVYRLNNTSYNTTCKILKYPCQSMERIQPCSSDNEPSSVYLVLYYIPALPTVTTQQWASFQQAMSAGTVRVPSLLSGLAHKTDSMSTCT